MKTVFGISIFLIMSLHIFAEGTRELMPNNTGNCYVQFNETTGGQSRQFALHTNTDTAHRLYIHIANIGEVINLGFKRLTTTNGAAFRIKDPAGNVVYDFTNIPTSGAGYISSFSEANIGPNTLVGGTGGYTPLTYTTLTTGDYYIEFQRINATTRHLFEFFDITVSSATNIAIRGRVWSFAWDLNTNSFTNRTYAVFYVYSDDMYITKVNVNGMQPYSFVIACNNKGAQNIADLSLARQSVPNANTVYPKYKIFLNTPDPNVYPVAVVPTMIDELQIQGNTTVSEPVVFYINMNKSGNLEIFLDIDETPGYQPGGRDVVLVKNIQAGGDTIMWNGNDRLGDKVTNTITVLVTSKFSTGVTHLPIYDAEKNEFGFLVTRIAPNGPEDLVLYWDDSQINHGTIPSGQVITMLSGNTTSNGHIWTTDSNNSDGFGNVHTINSWWNGYEINSLSSFTFTLLPIELIHWEAIHKGTYVELEWITASETNNHIFKIQRSSDGKEWHTISEIVGAGNSTSLIHYHEIDESPLNGTSYYRLQQIDFDGNNSFSKILALGDYSVYSKQIKVLTTQGANYINVSQEGISIQSISIKDIYGKSVTSHTQMTQISKAEIRIDVSNLPKGAYIIKSNTQTRIFYIH